MCSNAFIISLASAKQGWGPLLYDVLMEVATEMGKGLTPDRRSLSDSAKRVWSYYFSNRGDISKNVLDYKKSPFITPSDETDDCRSDVVETDWEYKNKEDDDFERRFSFYYDYDANQQLVGSQLTTALKEIFERITQDIFNASLAKW